MVRGTRLRKTGVCQFLPVSCDFCGLTRRMTVDRVSGSKGPQKKQNWLTPLA